MSESVSIKARLPAPRVRSWASKGSDLEVTIDNNAVSSGLYLITVSLLTGNTFKATVNQVGGSFNRTIVVEEAGIYSNLIEHLTIGFDTVENGDTYYVDVSSDVLIGGVESSNNTGGLIVGNSMKLVQLNTGLSDMGTSDWFSPAIDCMGFAGISFYALPSAGTGPSTIQLLGGISSGTVTLSSFGQCQSQNSANFSCVSSIFINGLNPGAARCGPRMATSQPYHALRFAGQTSNYRADIRAILHTQGGLGGG